MRHPVISKDPRNGIYLIRYQDEAGRWHSKSTLTRVKSEALEQLRNFVPPKAKASPQSLAEFIALYLASYAKNHHSDEVYAFITEPVLKRFHAFIEREYGPLPLSPVKK